MANSIVNIVTQVKLLMTNLKVIGQLCFTSIKQYVVVYLLVVATISVTLTFALKKEDEVYTGNIQFLLKESSGGAVGGGLSDVLGSIGLGGSEKADYDRLIALIKTQRLKRSILTAKYQDITIGDAIVESYGLNWMLESIGLKDFKFSSYEDSTIDNNLNLKAAVRKVGEVLTGTKDYEGLLSMDYDRKTKILNMVASTNSDDLSIAILYATYGTLERFFDNNLIQNKKNQYDILQHKIDSLKSVVNSKEIQLAQIKDKERNVVLYESMVRPSRLRLEIDMLYQVIEQLTTNAALMEFAVLSTPQGFVLLDEPIKPLYYGKRAMWKVVAFSIVLGVVLGTLVVLISYVFRQPASLEQLKTTQDIDK